MLQTDRVGGGPKAHTTLGNGRSRKPRRRIWPRREAGKPRGTWGPGRGALGGERWEPEQPMRNERRLSRERRDLMGRHRARKSRTWQEVAKDTSKPHDLPGAASSRGLGVPEIGACRGRGRCPLSRVTACSCRETAQLHNPETASDSTWGWIQLNDNPAWGAWPGWRKITGVYDGPSP